MIVHIHVLCAWSVHANSNHYCYELILRLYIHCIAALHHPLQSLGVLTASLTLTWESNDVTAQDLDTDSSDFRTRVYTFVAMGLFSVVYAGVDPSIWESKLLTCLKCNKAKSFFHIRTLIT